MGIFVAEDSGYDLSRRQYGFNRYKQLLSLYGMHFIKVNLITCLGFTPLALGISMSIYASSLLMLIPAGFLGGAILGPFLAGLYDILMRGLRDAPNHWLINYKKSWKQNWKASLLPGALTGLIVSLYAFMLYMMFSASIPPTPGTLALLAFSAMLFFAVSLLYWPQLVLFEQKNGIRIRNAMLFIIQHFWRVMGLSLLMVVYFTVYVLFAPWSILLVPFIGLWFILFVCEFLLYEKLDKALHIDEQFFAIEGNPWEEEDADETEAMISNAYARFDIRDDE